MDYVELTEVSVIFSPGVSSQTVTLTTLSDLPAEGDEDLRARLTVSSNNIDSSRVDIVVPEAQVTIAEEIGMCFPVLHTMALCIVMFTQCTIHVVL